MGNPCMNIGFGLAFIALVGIIYTLASKEWKVNSTTSSQASLVGVHSYEGLWVRCTQVQAGTIQCDNYDESFLALPTYLQAQRAMMCIAAIAAAFGVIAGAVGLPCIKAMEGTKAKLWTGRSGGGLMLFAGILTIVCVSWYATEVIQDFSVSANTANSGGFVYELGPALYCGWIFGSLALLSGILLACCNCGAKDDEDDYRYAYKPSKPPATTTNRAAEYV